MNRTSVVIGLSLTTSALAVFAERDAAACGGCFHPPTQTASDITDERMLLAVSTTQSTLYDQIRYAGSPTSFAWVLPIHGTVTVGLSADVLFDSIDVLTTTTILPPEPSCLAPPRCGAPSGAATSAGGDAGAAGVVTVTKAENVGPYATVQLHATDSSALDSWLAQNGFNIPANVVPVINQYVSEGFDFLAMKLLPNQGVQSMRPVRVTTPGASLSLPLRMAAVGTGATVGITIWVVSDGRYEPQNFPFYHIDDSALVWDFSTNLSNYTTLRAQNEAALGGKGWEIESSLNLNQQLITSTILSGGQYYGSRGFGASAPPPADATLDYLAVGSPDAGAASAGYKSAEDVRTADIAALFAGLSGSNVRVTRMRSDISHAAMTKDFVLAASSDQSEISNIRNVTKSLNLVCPVYNNSCGPGPGSSSGGATYAADASAGGVADAAGGSSSGASSAASGPANGAPDATVGSSSGAPGATAGSSSGASSATGGPSSGAPNAAGGSTGGSNVAAGGSAPTDSGGCAASPQSGDGSATSFGALAALLGLALVRTRRRSG